jgi:hypothetical protein
MLAFFARVGLALLVCIDLTGSRINLTQMPDPKIPNKPLLVPAMRRFFSILIHILNHALKHQ